VSYDRIKVKDYIIKNFPAKERRVIISAIMSANIKVSGDYVLNFQIDPCMKKSDFIMSQFVHHATKQGVHYWHDYVVKLRKEEETK